MEREQGSNMQQLSSAGIQLKFLHTVFCIALCSILNRILGEKSVTVMCVVIGKFGEILRALSICEILILRPNDYSFCDTSLITR